MWESMDEGSGGGAVRKWGKGKERAFGLIYKGKGDH